MTLTELMKVAYHDQTVMLIIGEDSITGNAEALDNYICTEVAEADVVEINVVDSVMKVWVK